LKEALEGALSEAEIDLNIPTDFTGVRGLYPDNVRVNKILYTAIEDLNLPVLRTWFKYGQYEPHDEFRPKFIDPSDLTNPDEYVHSGERTAVTKSDVKEAILELDISKIFEQDLYEFLRDNYNNKSPKKYKQIYLSSTDIIEVTDKIWNSSDSEVIENIELYSSQFRKASMDLRYEIENIEFENEPDTQAVEFEEHITTALQTYEDLFVGVEDSSAPSPDHLDELRQSRTRYHTSILPRIAIRISLDEMKGPVSETEEFSNSGREIHNKTATKDWYTVRGWKEELEENNLLAGIQSRRRVSGGRQIGSVDAIETASMRIGNE
jgi:hypothetical protein